MEESALILAELQRIRVLLSRFIVFAAVFALLVVLPALAMMSYSAYVWTFGLDNAWREAASARF